MIFKKKNIVKILNKITIIKLKKKEFILHFFKRRHKNGKNYMMFPFRNPKFCVSTGFAN